MKNKIIMKGVILIPTKEVSNETKLKLENMMKKKAERLAKMNKDFDNVFNICACSSAN